MPAPPAKNEISAAYPTPSAGAARVGFGKLYDYLIALLGLTGNPAEARDALGIGPVISNRNVLVNGNFAINQRAVSGNVVVAPGQYCHDRWKAGAGGCSYTFATVGKNTTITITAGSLVQIVQASSIEGGNYVMSWTGTSLGKIGAGVAAGSGVSAAGVIAGANLAVEFGVGTLGKVQLELGTVPTVFEQPVPELELAKCLRRCYFFRNPSGGVYPIASGGIVSAPSTSIGNSLRFPKMAGVPTITFAGGYYVYDGTSNHTASVITPVYVTDDAFSMDCLTATATLTVGRPTTIYASAGATAKLEAEL